MIEADKIKLRIFNKVKEKMVFGPREGEENASWILAVAHANNQPVMRWAEVQDQTGKDIYEDDVVKYNDCFWDVKYKSAVGFYLEKDKNKDLFNKINMEDKQPSTLNLTNEIAKKSLIEGCRVKKI
ncbi:MAG: hypothetical protein GY830_07735 [Bacteroidetes bacterium]|nr:hypothetical protein [Bacteroidota bacterium]